MVADEELPLWYRAADAFVFPSRKEGWGLAVLEAMASGLPVVVTDIPVFREYLLPGQDALLVPPGQPASLAAAMREMTTDTGLRARLRRAGARVAGRFRWEDTARRHQSVYERIAQRRPTRLTT
jgi:glycosyltransferase involved in cell wall biosynthesis